LQDPPKFTKIGIFGLKISHLATLLRVTLAVDQTHQSDRDGLGGNDAHAQKAERLQAGLTDFLQGPML
jgi:hypothetical protein